MIETRSNLTTEDVGETRGESGDSDVVGYSSSVSTQILTSVGKTREGEKGRIVKSSVHGRG